MRRRLGSAAAWAARPALGWAAIVAWSGLVTVWPTAPLTMTMTNATIEAAATARIPGQRRVHQQDGTLRPAFIRCRSFTAPASVFTLTSCKPATAAPAASEQLAAGTRKTVAPNALAPASFC